MLGTTKTFVSSVVSPSKSYPNRVSLATITFPIGVQSLWQSLNPTAILSIRMFGELGDLELQSLLVAIQKLDEAAQSLGIDVVAELKSSHTLTDIFEMIAERQRRQSA